MRSGMSSLGPPLVPPGREGEFLGVLLVGIIIPSLFTAQLIYLKVPLRRKLPPRLPIRYSLWADPYNLGYRTGSAKTFDDFVHIHVEQYGGKEMCRQVKNTG